MNFIFLILNFIKTEFIGEYTICRDPSFLGSTVLNMFMKLSSPIILYLCFVFCTGPSEADKSKCDNDISSKGIYHTNSSEVPPYFDLKHVGFYLNLGQVLECCQQVPKLVLTEGKTILEGSLFVFSRPTFFMFRSDLSIRPNLVWSRPNFL